MNACVTNASTSCITIDYYKNLDKHFLKYIVAKI